MITVADVYLNFGGVKAVDGASFCINEGEIIGLIGPNGAGKTTLFNVIAGVYKPTFGTVFLDGENVTGLKPYQLFNKGLLRTFQITKEFASLSVLENLMMVPGNQFGESLMNTWFARKKVARQEEEIREKALEVIGFLKLEHLTSEPAGNLSGGQKKLLELGRTMMVNAKVVLLDEVAAGVNRTLLREISSAISRLNRDYGYTFCMIEHDIEFLSNLCQKIIVMVDGKVFLEGTPEDVRSNESVIEAYLGKSNSYSNGA